MNLASIAGNIQGDKITVYTEDEEITGRAVNIDYGFEGLTLEPEEDTGEDYRWIQDFKALDHEESMMYFEKAMPSEVIPNRFRARSYDQEYLRAAMDEVQQYDNQHFVPMVQKMPEGHYEIVDGHKTYYSLLEIGHEEEMLVRVLSPENELNGLEMFA